MSRSNSHDMKAARRWARTARTCPSCGAARGLLPGGQEQSGQVLVHAEGCELTTALAAVSGERGADAAWFHANPGERHFSRMITTAEITEAVIGYPHDPAPSPLTVVQVSMIAPGLRCRVFADPVPAASAN